MRRRPHSSARGAVPAALRPHPPLLLGGALCDEEDAAARAHAVQDVDRHAHAMGKEGGGGGGVRGGCECALHSV